MAAPVESAAAPQASTAVTADTVCWRRPKFDPLELARTDGKLIHELEIADHLLGTPSGIRWVMPFVTRAQEILAVSACALFRQHFPS